MRVVIAQSPLKSWLFSLAGCQNLRVNPISKM